MSPETDIVEYRREALQFVRVLGSVRELIMIRYD
jgi:hypothetical protein